LQKFNLITIPTFHDSRGALSVIDQLLPFPVVRIYWIYEADGYVRGGHRHHKTRQALVAINGQASIYMNDGTHSATINLTNSTQCLMVEPKDWHTMTLSNNAVLLVLSSHSYELTDYIDEPYE
jgi:dTDP-4-dehydrorhamnose 3,5-epimerase-like enzyme